MDEYRIGADGSCAIASYGFREPNYSSLRDLLDDLREKVPEAVLGVVDYMTSLLPEGLVDRADRLVMWKKNTNKSGTLRAKKDKRTQNKSRTARRRNGKGKKK